MSQRQTNIYALIIWIIGLLGYLGLVNPAGFFALIIPLLFWLLGDKLTKNHAKAYFNVLITAALIYAAGMLIDEIAPHIKLGFYSIRHLAYVYFGIMSIVGIFQAANYRKIYSNLSLRVFK